MFSSLTTFFAGVACGLGVMFVWHGFRFVLDLRATRRAVVVNVSVTEESDKRALAAVTSCKAKLRLVKSLNPEWITPLVDEVPRLIREIAAIYHPDSQNPILAPGISHFAMWVLT